MNRRTSSTQLVAIAVAVFATAAAAVAQPAPPPAEPARESRGVRGPIAISPEVQTDRRVAFHIRAPQAQSVRLIGTDIPGNLQGTAMTKGDNGIWEITLGPIDPGAYRYNFTVDGVPVIDPVNPAVSESNNNVWSLFYVPGAEFMDIRDIPHGTVAAATYYSRVLKRFRRMHVYTPPGYEMGRGKYPVFYLLHGAGDCDDSWTSVGRAGFILDNLIAANKAKPMVVVMPAGHTSRGFRERGAPDDFVQEFLDDILPYAESHYRIIADRQHRAIAGLSMGGGQTLNIAIPHLDRFAYVGVYSAGVFGIAGPVRPPGAPPATPSAPAPPSGPAWEEQHAAELDNAAAKRGLRLLWFGTGADDFLIGTTRATVDMLKKHGFQPVYQESPGGHTWINWRNYLNEFAPQLFQ
ncbi:MAG: alpha/beta hydrolase-fold protein [Bryobacteraceae bacterium]|jgi:enterochelin esterase family protein